MPQNNILKTIFNKINISSAQPFLCPALTLPPPPLPQALEFLRRTLKWRAEKKPWAVRCDGCAANPRTHSLRCIGQDAQQRPARTAAACAPGLRPPAAATRLPLGR